MLVGTLATPKILSSPFAVRAQYAQAIVDLGIDHVFIADHVSFHNGTGMDGLINAATLTALHPDLKVCVGVYLLALRHPITVARQLATIAESAPGQLILGVGVGGEDRNEIRMCGVDPATRGKRTDECLQVLNGLLTGETMDFKGRFFEFEKASIKPAPAQPIPVLIGGRADAAIRRTAIYGDGWLGLWSSPSRYAAVLDQINEHAHTIGRQPPAQHGLQVWVGIDDNRERAKARLAKGMENFYHVPFARFEKYNPWGTAEEVAEWLSAYRDAGCQLFNIMPLADSDQAGIEAVARIRELLMA
ncbi:MAG: LLM class flavin-dependent oxidoreductase [Proteobacteria bacterium]|nr:LLM class flavin-dependent oxidoreductase [Pseudomonadota bacterium]